MSRLHNINGKHRVRSHHWNSGILSVRTMIFDAFVEAEEYVRQLECHSAKIYDEEEVLICEYSGIFHSYA